MIETTGDPSGLASGWLKRYIDAVRGTRFPPSYHFLVGMFALSSLVGRKAMIRRNSFRLFPPCSIILLGSSGVGKSKSLSLGRLVVELASQDRPGFCVLNASSFTTRGLMERWMAEQERSGLGKLEGIVTVNEASAILTAKTGTETMAQWLIDLLEHEDVKDVTGYKGTSVVKNITVGLGICSTVDYLRKSIGVDQFAGGLMHRFLIAHEIRRPDSDESPVAYEDLTDLATEASSIVEGAPEEMTITADGETELRAIGRRAEKVDLRTTYLSGFWNRFGYLVSRVGAIFALSDGRMEIDIEHIRKAEWFLRRFVYPPLEALVIEMSYGTKQQAIFRLADELYYAGPKGMDGKEFRKRLPATSDRIADDMVRLMQRIGLVWMDRKGRVYRLEGWAKGNAE